MSLSASWQFWALVAAVFAALTAIFAKIGISDIDSDLATFIRTCVIMLVLGAILTAMGKWRQPQSIPLKTWIFLGLLGLATGASWLALFFGRCSSAMPRGWRRSTNCRSCWWRFLEFCSWASIFPR